MRTEKEVEKLEGEIKAIKASFQQSASMMEVYTASCNFSTSPNVITWNGNGHWTPLHYTWLDTLYGQTVDGSGNTTGYGRERIIVTFTCTGGINTFASLELEPIDMNDGTVWIKRIPYSGGARWVVYLNPNGVYNGQGVWQSWKANKLKFYVQSAMAGTVGAKMAWQ